MCGFSTCGNSSYICTNCLLSILSRAINQDRSTDEDLRCVLHTCVCLPVLDLMHRSVNEDQMMLHLRLVLMLNKYDYIYAGLCCGYRLPMMMTSSSHYITAEIINASAC